MVKTFRLYKVNLFICKPEPFFDVNFLSASLEWSSLIIECQLTQISLVGLVQFVGLSALILISKLDRLIDKK